MPWIDRVTVNPVLGDDRLTMRVPNHPADRTADGTMNRGEGNYS